MEIITMVQVMSILAPYAILIFWIIQLGRKQQKLRTEFFKKLSDSETERDNIINEFKKAVNENFEIGNENSKKQDKNWKNAKKKFDELDETNEENLEIFQEFDYIIQELDKKVNEVSDEQEEILMRKDLDTQQINIVCEKLEKLTLKRDRYENRLTEVCKALDDLNSKINEQSHGLNTVIDYLGKEEIRLTETNVVIKKNDREINAKVSYILNFLKSYFDFSKYEVEIINKVDFDYAMCKFKKGDLFKRAGDTIYVNNNFGYYVGSFDYSLWLKLLEANQINHDTRQLYDNVTFDQLENKVSEIDRTLNKVIQRQLQAKSLKEILENPIEVTKPSCETKLKMKEHINQNDVESITRIVNKVDFKHSHGSFKKGDIFILDKDDLKVYRNKILLYDYNSWTTFGKNVMKKLLQLNEN